PTTLIYTLSLHDALPISFLILAGSMHLVLGSQSTKTAVAPPIQIASAVAKNVFGWVITSSPLPMPSAISASQMASVPLARPTARSEEHTSELQSRSDLVC